MRFNFNDEEAMIKYKQITSKAGYFSDCFRTNKTFLGQFKEWENKFNQTLSKCFKKVRINNKRKFNENSKRIENKINLRKEALKNSAEVEEIEEYDEDIHEEEQAVNAEKIKRDMMHFKTLGFQRGMWKLTKQIFSKESEFCSFSKSERERNPDFKSK